MKNRLIGVLFLAFFPAWIMAQQALTPTPAWRPAYHFSPPQNWTNDPNGLIYRNGEYHLYYQHNPFENKWGHMSWGHAVSTDLIRWKHLPVAIPEVINQDTTWIFSGSAVWDKTNSSGFAKDKNSGSLVAIYTADQPNRKKESQFIAYSNDNGLSWTNYDKNPVIDLNKKDFRDPNVFWHEQTRQWIMAVALPVERMVQFYSSANLRDWKLLSEFGKQGDVANIWECPALLPLPVDGNNNKMKWLLLVSTGFSAQGPNMHYFVGDFDGKTFTNTYPTSTLRVDDGYSFYAAIPWNDAPNQQKILLGWLVPGAQETSPWKGQMSIPRDLSLKTTPDGIRLYQQPSSIVRQGLAQVATGQPLFRQNQVLTSSEAQLTDPIRFKHNANWIEAEFEIGSAKSFGLKVAQKKSDGGSARQETVIGYDVSARQLYVDRSQSGKGIKNPQYAIDKTTIQPQNGKLKLQVLVDGSSLEVFANDGQKVITAMIYPDDDATSLSLFANEGTATLKTLTVWDLSGLKTEVARSK